MAKYTDNNDRTWIVNLTIADVKNLRQRLDFDLLGRSDEVFQRLAGDPVLMVDTLWVLLEDQAKAAGVDETAFARSLGGDAIEAATMALVEAITDFFPSQRRAVWRKMLDKNQATDRATLEMLATQIDAIDPMKEASQLLDALLPAGKPSTDSPESSESTSDS